MPPLLQQEDIAEGARRPPSSRRYRSIRGLILAGAAIYAAGGMVDWFVFEERRLQAIGLRELGAAALLLVWWLSGCFRSSAMLTALVLMGLLAAGGAQALLIQLDPDTALAALPTYVLLILIASPLWPDLRHQLAGMLVCVAPALAALAWVDAAPKLWISYVGYLGVSIAIALTLWRQRLLAVEESARLRAELERQAISDALTGVLNRGGWYAHAARALAAIEAQGAAASLIYFDLDRFKEVNDRFGHAVGDVVIERAAAVIRAQMRSHDLLARLGGEEFVALLPAAHLGEARAVAERVRETCREMPELRGRTISAGIAERRPGEVLAVLMARADAALLHAKACGRDRVMASPQPVLVDAGD